MEGFLRLPKVLTAELTYRCNHRCLFCSCPWEADPAAKEAELSADDWEKIFFAVRQRGVEQITFSGGEAILRDDFFRILSDAKSHGFSIGLISNGRNLDNGFLERLSRFNVLLSVSVPGIETFPQTTGGDNLEHVLGIFERCGELGIRTVANVAVTKINIGELYENIALPLLHGAFYVLLNRFLPGGRGLKNTRYLLSVDEINKMFDVAEEVLERAGRYGHVGTELPFCVIKDPKKYKRLQISSLCAAAKSFFVIDPSGYVKVCNHSPVRLCKWTEMDGLEQNSYWQRFASRDYIPETCRGCEYLGVKCDGGCREAAHVYSGNVTDRDPCFESVCQTETDRSEIKF
ncbi:MAG: radical SAM protein [Candidatus Gallimonas sp.]